MIFADPPYFLSSGGLGFKNGKITSVNKGSWDKVLPITQIHEYNRNWISECHRILKPNGTIWISGTYHNIYSIGMSLQQMDFKILNNITWLKTNPPPNVSQKYFTHSTENIIWARKSKTTSHYFNYELMKIQNNGKQMRDTWTLSPPYYNEKKFGKHPTQKPLALLDRIVLASTKIDQIVLDPFNGSGTTGIAALSNGRRYIGIDFKEEYLSITKKRINELKKL